MAQHYEDKTIDDVLGGKSGLIYLIVNFAHGRSTRASVFQPDSSS